MTFAHPSFLLNLLAFAQRLGVYAALGWIAAEGDTGGWAILLPVLVAVTTLDAVVNNWRPWALRPMAALRLAFFFLKQSVRGGVDVALRAVHPRLPIAPDIVQFSTSLSQTPARVLFANTLSLLPGTLTVKLDDEHMQVHVLDTRLDVEQTLRALESLIAALYGIDAGKPPERRC